MSEALSLDAVRHVARLARLQLSPEQLEIYREQLAGVLEHIDRLERVDVEGVDPMAHPLAVTNRLADDVVESSMSRETLHENAPAVRDAFLTVPKVLEEGGGSS